MRTDAGPPIAADPGTDDDEPMSARMTNYVRKVCASRGIPFDPDMTRGKARALLAEKKRTWMNRGEVREVACPRCGASAGEPCTLGCGKVRNQNHVERVRLAAQLRPT